MQSYLERYLGGEHAGVWAELVALGPNVRDEPVYGDSRAVADEMMRRARQNIQLLVERLQELEYRFLDPELVWRPPDANILSKLDSVEARYGLLPMVIRKWFEVVGEVDFMGAHPKLSQHDGKDWGDSEQLGIYSDPLMVTSFSLHTEAVLSFYINFASDWDEMERMERENPPPYGVDIGLSAINKANQSGSGAVQIMFPNPAFDAPLIDGDDYWMGTFFIPYLRSCFQWGGFPGLREVAEPDVPKEELGFLTDGLLAI